MGPQPPLAHTWARLRAWLAREYPELGDTLNYGLPAPELAALELQLGGLELPAAVRDSYLCADGQEPESAAACTAGLFFGLTLLPFEDVLEEWRFWREVDDDPQTGANPRLRTLMGSVPPGFVRREYSARGWIPLAADKAGNYLGVDLAPDERGAAGQVIVFGRDVDTKVVLWRGDGPDGWARWLASFADELEAGETFEFAGTRADGSDGEDEDDIGYGGYYYDGAGRGHGDSGGDGGAGGLQLVGEYRGWDVLQAWADRSIRRWQAAGAYPDTSVLDSGTSQVGRTRLHRVQTSADGHPH
jgi:cell wall assembly regulator SMI1